MQTLLRCLHFILFSTAKNVAIAKMLSSDADYQIYYLTLPITKSTEHSNAFAMRIITSSVGDFCPLL